MKDRKIKRLPESVINRIAAGEVVQRASSAVKELIENSIDAGATKITVTVVKGGLELISVKDNGSGINKEDLKIVCVRHTTSKLVEFEDLENIATFGFRGEALASLSQIAKVSIITKQEADEIGYKATYTSGKLDKEPVPLAANTGTTIIINDMFYNIPTRKAALRKETYEYQRVLDVIKKYSIHYSMSSVRDNAVSFSCKSKASKVPDVVTKTNSSQIEVIREIYGKKVASELLELTSTQNVLLNKKDSSIEILSDNRIDQKKSMSEIKSSDTELLTWSCNGFISNSNFSIKKSEMIFFINNRLVTNRKLFKTIENLYVSLIRKGTFPFIYLSLTLPSQHLDVNIHPSKSEVCFLFEAEVTDYVVEIISKTLKNSTESRTFTTPIIGRKKQRIIPDSFTQSQESIVSNVDLTYNCHCDNHIEHVESNKNFVERAQTVNATAGNVNQFKSLSNDQAVALRKTQSLTSHRPEKKIRTDSSMKKLNHYWRSSAGSSPISSSQSSAGSADILLDQPTTPFITRTEVIEDLASIKELKNEIEARKSVSLKSVLQEMVFVGVVDNNYILTQYKTYLYLVDIVELAKELFYQQVIFNFSKFSYIFLSNKLNIYDIFSRLLLDQQYFANEAHTEDSVTQFCCLLDSKKEMLNEYFSLNIRRQDESDIRSLALASIPYVLRNYDYQVQIEVLPVFLYRICKHVNWEDEKECFKTISFEIAEFYSVLPRFSMTKEDTEDNKYFKELVSTVLLPCIKENLIPPLMFENEDNCVISVVTNTTELYKSFERT